MKKRNQLKVFTVTAAFAMAMFAGCQGKKEISVEEIISAGDMTEIRKTKQALSEQQKQLEQKIARLDSAINANKSSENLPLVTAFTAEEKPFHHYIELQGDVTTQQNVLVYPEMAGTLVEIRVKKGQRVAEGDVLAVIDNGGMTSQLLQMKVQLELAKTTYERQERLYKQNIGSEIQYLQAKTSYDAQAKAIEQMESQLDKFNVRAPFSGIIDDVIKEQGTVVAPGPGSEIFRIVNLSNMYIEVAVPEVYLSSIKEGKDVKVFFPVLNETLESTVRRTSNFIDPNNRSFLVEIPVPNQNGTIKPNLTAKVQINDYHSEKAILIPQSVISENAEGEQYTFVLANENTDNIGKVSRNIITTGKTQGDFVEVLSGITHGQRIIQEGARSVRDGQEVKILNL